MTAEEVSRLPHGLYEIVWKNEWGGGSSHAAVGSMYNGKRWMAPTNWTAAEASIGLSRSPGTCSQDHWDKVERGDSG